MNELEAINRRLAEIEDEKRQLLQRKQQLQQPFSTKLQPIPQFGTDQKTDITLLASEQTYLR